MCKVKFDTINSLKKYLQTNKDWWDALIRNNIIKIDNNYLYVNPKHYKSEKFAIQSVYELFE